MADYFKIKNYSKSGEIAISRRVFEDIASDATNRVKGASVSRQRKNSFYLTRPVQVSFRKNGQVEVAIQITLKKDENVAEVCKRIQEEVSSSLMAYCESVPFDIEIKVANIA